MGEPIIKDPLTRGAKIYQYRKWADKLFEDDDAETRVPGSKALRKAHPGGRPGKSARRK
jgi:hypothetical protein